MAESLKHDSVGPVEPGILTGASAPLHPSSHPTLPSGSSDPVAPVVTGFETALRTWKSFAMLVGVNVEGPIASGGILMGPQLAPLILRSVNGATLAAEDMKIVTCAAKIVSGSFLAWQYTVKVPGLAWYPDLAAFPGPVATPTPNAPTPLADLDSVPGAMSDPVFLKLKIAAAVAAAGGPDAPGIYASIAQEVTQRFGKFLASTWVCNVLATGPVPSFAEPDAKPGPVSGGVASSLPGCLV